MDEMELMNYEYEAWADVVATLTDRRNVNDEDLYAAIARWGERLVALREPQSDEIKTKARDEAEDAWARQQSEEMRARAGRGLSRSRRRPQRRGEEPPGSNGRGEGRPSPGSNGT